MREQKWPQVAVPEHIASAFEEASALYPRLASDHLRVLAVSRHRTNEERRREERRCIRQQGNGGGNERDQATGGARTRGRRDNTECLEHRVRLDEGSARDNAPEVRL